MKTIIYCLCFLHLCAPVAFSKSSEDCPNTLRALGYSKRNHLINGVGLNFAYLPYAIYHYVRARKQLQVDEVEQGRWITLGHLGRKTWIDGLVNLGFVWWNFNHPFAINWSDVDEEIGLDESEEDEDRVAVVNGFGKEDSQFEVVEKLHPNLDPVEPKAYSGLTPFEDALIRLSKKGEKQKMKQLLLQSHGDKATIVFGDYPVKLKDIRKANMGTGSLIVKGFDGVQVLPSFMEKGATVVVDGCTSAIGKDGEQFIRELGELLLPDGGRIVGLRRLGSSSSNWFTDSGALGGLGVFSPAGLALLGGVQRSLGDATAEEWKQAIEEPVFVYEVLPLEQRKK